MTSEASSDPSCSQSSKPRLQRSVTSTPVVVRQQSVEEQSFAGLLIREYTAGRSFESSVAEIICPAGSSHPLALSHRSTKFYYVLVGDVEFEIDGHQQTLCTGDMAVIPRDTPFRYRSPHTATRMLLVHTPAFVLGEEAFLEE